MAPSKTARDEELNIFDIAEDSDDNTTVGESDHAPHAVTSSGFEIPPQRQSVLSEVDGNNASPRPSADDLASQLADFHIVTPAKINKTRGLKPRPTIDLSTFDYPSEEQENVKVSLDAGGSSTQESLAQQKIQRHPSDSAQLTKHLGGKFDYVLTLPVVPAPAERAPVNGTPEGQQAIGTIQFGCNLVRGDGTSDIAKRNRSNPRTTYTLIATPLENLDKAEGKPAELVTETAGDLPTAAVIEVTELQTPSHTPVLTLTERQIISIEKIRQWNDRRLRESAPLSRFDAPQNLSITDRQLDSIKRIIGLEGPSASLEQSFEQMSAEDSAVEGPLNEVLELLQEAERVGLVRRMPEPGSTTIIENSPDKRGNLQVNGDHSSQHSSETSSSQPLVRADDIHGRQPGAVHSRAASRMSEVPSSEKGDVFDELQSLSPVASPSSRIEDSVEALDKLEEQIEALNDLAQLQPATASSAPKNTKKAAAVKPAGGNATVCHVEAVVASDQAEKTKVAPSKRLSVVSRPASLAPPKPLARSSKPPTVPAFELHGEIVAQRLKEKRLARMSMSMPVSTPNPNRTASPAKSKTATSTKPPTRSNFELTSAEISRRKAEERAAKLKAQQEEERKRREFKARPVPASVVAGATFPRQTAASLARISLKANASTVTAASAAASAPGATPSTAKRHSTIGPGMSTRPSFAGSTATSSVSRGRGNSPLPTSPAGLSRATSMSTGSVRGSSVSAEEKREQKMRGKEIFKRESSFVSEKERERRSREEAAKKAREQAAERSKKLARDWAEKQRAKRASTIGGPA